MLLSMTNRVPQAAVLVMTYGKRMQTAKNDPTVYALSAAPCTNLSMTSPNKCQGVQHYAKSHTCRHPRDLFVRQIVSSNPHKYLLTYLQSRHISIPPHVTGLFGAMESGGQEVARLVRAQPSKRIIFIYLTLLRKEYKLYGGFVDEVKSQLKE